MLNFVKLFPATIDILITPNDAILMSKFHCLITGAFHISNSFHPFFHSVGLFSLPVIKKTKEKKSIKLLHNCTNDGNNYLNARL